MYTGTTRRSGPLGPLRHAVARGLPKASRTGRNYSAMCGASVAYITEEGFDVRHPRACRDCVKKQGF